ncbi:helix-turn-helix domain-containing protein [Lentilactobacillus kribbianus]|uniref:helix-turn-helix domain-containing protein n=1 Tax=Lentilactobacillus kribbianus TaxID=2729622 RepID=UPI00155694DB|nr:helix-turn-helix transcriptional regulator [Lentilactobacillus kribbianus]
MDSKIKSNIPEFLKEKGITVSELSKGTGLSRTTLTDLSKSEYIPNKTRIETLTKISEYLNIPMVNFFGIKEVGFELIENFRIYDDNFLASKSKHIKKIVNSRKNVSAEPRIILGIAFLKDAKSEDYKSEQGIYPTAYLGIEGDYLRFQLLSKMDRRLIASSIEAIGGSMEILDGKFLTEDNLYLKNSSEPKELYERTVYSPKTADTFLNLILRIPFFKNLSSELTIPNQEKSFVTKIEVAYSIIRFAKEPKQSQKNNLSQFYIKEDSQGFIQERGSYLAAEIASAILNNDDLFDVLDSKNN